MYDFNQIDRDFFYDGNDLGVTITEEKTTFKTWAPVANCVFINLYQDGEGSNLIESLPMTKIDKGIWYIDFFRSLDEVFYTYTFDYNNEKRETIDIYAKACGVNGLRGAVVDFKTTNPKSWVNDKSPKCKTSCDAIIYETHIRDFSIDITSGVTKKNRGKYLAFTESHTRYLGVNTCLSHLKELGITHVHLLPTFDFKTTDEAHPELNQFNWGYDPLNYNIPEGSYSSDPYNPKTRIIEFKKMVMALHQQGIGVIMDVVYNHTFDTEDSSFHKSFPFYYHRERDGWFSNGSGCGNELASERLMVRKYIIDSLIHWVTEYNIDGFRFDLMGLIDTETINIVRDKLNEINPNILMYGEGWAGGEPALEASKLAYKWNSYNFGRVGLFNDNIRDAIKGGVFNAYDTGYVSGNLNTTGIIKRSIVGSINHHMLTDANEACWAYAPTQTINYTEAHDNYTLWDKISVSAKHYTLDERIRMDKLAGAIVILSQGVPFIQLGQDFLRSKPKILKAGETFPNKDLIYDSNSYNSPDETNSIKWNKKAENYGVFKYYKALIAVRKEYSELRMSNNEDVNQYLSFFDTGDSNIIGFTVEGKKTTLAIIFNPYTETKTVKLPAGNEYAIRLDPNGKNTSRNGFSFMGSLNIEATSCYVLIQKN